MGYILPVDRYQYSNYHERLRLDKTSISPVNPSFRAILDEKYRQLSNQSDRLLPSSFKRIPLGPVESQKNLRAYAEITGKGRRFNETI